MHYKVNLLFGDLWPIYVYITFINDARKQEYHSQIDETSAKGPRCHEHPDARGGSRSPSITAIPRRARMTPSLPISPENAAAGWQCPFNKCPWRAVGKGTNRLEPQTQCLVMAQPTVSRNPVPLRRGRFPRNLLYARCPFVMFHGYYCCRQRPSVRARARLHDHCDLISAQIDGQTTVINPGRLACGAPARCSTGGSIGNIIVLIS